ncbi:MAG: hypothetical protein Q7S46_08505 [Gallionella sp.]|nr:hypothetical protein [Gallionella sp.]
MAAAIIQNEEYVIDQVILEDLVVEVNPSLEERPDVWTRATVAIVQPHLEALVSAYRNACKTHTGRLAAQLFLQNLLDAEA